MNVEIPRNTNATSSFDIPYSVFDIQNSLKVNGIELAPAFHPRHLSAQEVRAIRGWHCPKDTLVVAKAKLGLVPRFRKRFGALTLDGNRMQTRSRASSPKIAIGLEG